MGNVSERYCKMSEEKYLIWNQRGVGWSHDDWVRYHGLSIAKSLNRTVILDDMIIDPYHNMAIHKDKISKRMYNEVDPQMLRRCISFEDAEKYDPRCFYDWEKINKIVSIKFKKELSDAEIDDIENNELREKVSTVEFGKKYSFKYLIMERIITLPDNFYADFDSAQLFSKNIFLIIDNLKYSSKIKQIAQNIIHLLKDYDAIHVRRGDNFVFSDLWGSTIEERKKSTDLNFNIDKIKKIIKPGRKIYIATDEIDISFFDGLKKYYNIYFRQNFEDMLKKEIPENCYNIYYLLCIEEEIMSKAFRFIGTTSSSINLTVDWMRSEVNGIDKRIYHITPSIYKNYIKNIEFENKRYLMKSPSYEECLKRIVL